MIALLAIQLLAVFLSKNDRNLGETRRSMKYFRATHFLLLTFGALASAQSDSTENGVVNVTSPSLSTQGVTLSSTELNELDDGPTTPGPKEVACDETIEEDTEISSPQYPRPYPEKVSRTWCLNMEKGTGVDIVFEDLDIDPKSDYVVVKGTDPGTAYHVTGNKGANQRFVQTRNVVISFIANQTPGHKFKGFRMKVAAFGEATTTPQPSTTTPTPPPRDAYVTIVRELEMSKELQENRDTFDHVIPEILMKSTNKWLELHNLTDQMERCRTEDVVIPKVMPCPTSWPRNSECIRLEFAIPLNESDSFIGPSKSSDIQINEEYELTKENLDMIWREFARQDMLDAGFPEYQLPGAQGILLIWTSVSLLIILLFLGVLYGIWKLDFLQDYRRMKEETEDEVVSKRSSQLDPSLYPSPNQIVPPFMSEQDTYSGFDPKFVINDDPEDNVFDARLPKPFNQPAYA